MFHQMCSSRQGYDLALVLKLLLMTHSVSFRYLGTFQLYLMDAHHHRHLGEQLMCEVTHQQLPAEPHMR